MASKHSQHDLEMVLSRKLQHKIKLTPRPVVTPLPGEDMAELRTMAIKSTWQNNILNSPVHIARKCPVLPGGLIPRSAGHGLSVPTRNGATYDANTTFHGFPFPKPVKSNDNGNDNTSTSAPPSPPAQQEARCPYM